jgi:site-specific DNA-methyltransferase (adenine-specific)
MMELRPIVYDPDTMHILGGNQRLAALRKMGKTEIPDSWVKSTDEMTDKEKREFILRDNVQSGEWDFGVLEENFADFDLDDIGIELPDSFGIDEPEVTEDDYEQPEQIDTDIKLGDLFSLRKDGKEIHRLLCGDATKKEDVERLMGGAKADMVFTDPPYNVAYGDSSNPRYTAHISGKHKLIANDNMEDADWITFNKNLAAILINYNAGDVYVWGAPSPDGMRQRLTLVDNGIHWSATIIWKKDKLVLAAGKYQRMYEPCFYGWPNGLNSSFVGDRKNVEVWEIDRPRISDLHPTMKPIDLCGMGINNSSVRGASVLDIFLGSGSTMVACHQLDRKCYGMEIEPTYCQVTLDRMRKLDPEIEVVKIDG